MEHPEQKRIEELEALLKEIRRTSGLMLYQNNGRWDFTKEHIQRAVNVTQSNINRIDRCLGDE
jgi:hypothetical protein